MKSGAELPFADTAMESGLAGFVAGSLLFPGVRRIIAAGPQRMLGWAALLLLATALFFRRSGEPVFGTLLWHSLVLFPLLVCLSLTLRPVAGLLSLRVLTHLGDISYSVYLLHMPVQLAMPAGRAVRRPRSTTGSSSCPAQIWLRRRYRSQRARADSRVSRSAARPARAGRDRRG